MDAGPDRHARHVRGLVAASEVLASPGMSAAGRLRRLCEIAKAAVLAGRAAIVVTADGGGAPARYRTAPPVGGGSGQVEQAVLADPSIRQRLARREVVELGAEHVPVGRGVVLIAPMVLEGRLLGGVYVEGEPGGAHHADDLTANTLSGLANMAAHVLLAEHLRSDRAEVLSRELLTEQRNRRRLSNRLHDGPQQVLISLRMRLELLEREASGSLESELGVLGDQAEVARESLRALILDLDTMTGHTVLTNAVRSLLEMNASLASWRTTFEVDDGVDDVCEATQLTVERVVQEALANARQHAQASEVSMQVRRDGGMITVIVADDGVGIPSGVPTTSTGHGGIRAMHERIWLVGGTLHVDGRAGQGTTVVLTAPRHA